MNISILQWNIWIKENPDKIIKFLKEVDADIVCLQEVSENFEKIGFINVPNRLNEELDYSSHYFIAHSWETPNGEMTQGNMILSKFPIKNIQTLTVRENNTDSIDKYANEGRVLGIVEVEINHKIYTVATTHLSYTHKIESEMREKKEEDKLVKRLKEYHSNLIFTGDLNIDENSRLIKRLEEFLVNAGPDYSKKTWTTKPFKYMDYDISELKYRLDYIFVSKNLEISDSQIINTEYSDHLPILVKLTID